MHIPALDSSPNRVVDAITRGILAGRYVPGQRLIEADLTRELGVSRGPVREALKRLAGEGILTITRNRGAYVRAQSRRDVTETLVVLESLTGLAARLAAEHIDEDKHREKLKSSLETLLGFHERGENVAYFEARRHFYDCIIAIAGNRELARLMPQMQINLLRLQFEPYVTQEYRDRHFIEYAAIAQAVFDGDGRAAERETRKHLQRRREHLSNLPDSAYAAAGEDSD